MANPNPTRISDAMWWLWTEFDKLESSALLGGVYAAKPGYHNVRSALPSSDYSTGRDIAADKLGPAGKASAIDLTMSAAAMKLYSKRLDDAARAKDPRLRKGGRPILREFIGTKDGKTVYCWVFVGGKALGVGADSGPDPGRDSSHLWHLHLSFIREFIDDQVAHEQAFSVLAGEALTAWQTRTGSRPAPQTGGVKMLDVGGKLPELKRGMNDPVAGFNYIWRLQLLLGVTVDGDYGPQTAAAVAGYYQAQLNRKTDGGTVDAAMWRRLFAIQE